jgi:hypothetical protein
MHKSKYMSPLVFILLVAGILFIGCTPSGAPTQEIATTPPIPSATMTEMASPTNTPTSAETPTLTPEPTSTETPSITPSPTPNMVMPGTFYAGGCGGTNMSQGGRLEFCITGVTVDSNRHMIFAVSWTLSNIPGGYTVTKRSDQGNKNMYLIDNLGNRYNHVAGGGGAYSSVQVTDGESISGWFDFGQPPVGAFTFTFHDDDNGIVIGGISLYGGSAAPVISYQDLLLDQYPLLLRYQEELWQPSTFENSVILVSKRIPFCTVRAIPPAQPKGDYKSNIPVGDVTYEIYGYFDDAIGLFVREYVYVSGLTGIDPNLKPLFLITIPGDNSMACILDASNVLSTLTPQEQ